MESVELIIKISEEEYINIKNAIFSLIDNGCERDSMPKVCLAILDGIRIPKGHGRIVDESKINVVYTNTEEVMYGNIKAMRTMITHTDAPTILDAESEA